MKFSNLTLLPSLSLIPMTTTTSPTPNPQSTNNTLCDCYIISGPDPGYFTNYHFWDFRNIALPNVTQQPAPTPLALYTTLLLSNTPFINDWLPQTWTKTGTTELLPITNAETNVFIAPNPDPQSHVSPNPTYLLLQTTRHADHVSTAEIEFLGWNILHCSLRVRMRLMSKETALGPRRIRPPTRDPQDRHWGKGRRRPIRHNIVPKGACVGLFTYRSKTCESDIEILTSDPPNVIHYSNQPDYDPVSDTAIPGAGSMVNLSVPWTAWLTHRLDWFPNMSRWYAGEALQAVKAYGVPREPSTLVLNLWSDGGNWTGNLRAGESVFLGVEWIEMAFNVSSVAGAPAGRGEGLTRSRDRTVRRADFRDVDSDLRRVRSKTLEGDILKQENIRTGDKVGCRKACYVSDFH
ncbi:concanavalin A-like lectin/glucanase domain-containing protein [Aspergillus caelatus]|uniref:Concanavalin A-like lectin/glucanase domain-containing protein n=1 Tax=Aspergillus caelatus TaxID=61420 RepID=A0A5N6ZXQ8_9EURO|nr:concanavalin A-like lectin/glucanase domain-containing protein [Aspergillus caelatus]KAE8362367.1 concanavalin A-like lectin/glucanase domain-containing protein [Aspergillus caelatus]